MRLRAPLLPATIAALLCAGALTACSGAAPDAPDAPQAAVADAPTPDATEEAPEGLTYPSMWDIPEVPNASASDATFIIRYDGLLIDSTFAVPDVTEADAVAWLASAAAQWGISVPEGSTSAKGLGAASNMMATYQLDYSDGILFRYYHGWELPMENASVPVPLPPEWAALPLPTGATYQNAWVQYAYSPTFESVAWSHPAYFFTFTDDTADPRGTSDAWSAAVDTDEWISAPGDGGFTLTPKRDVDTDGMPVFGP